MLTLLVHTWFFTRKTSGTPKAKICPWRHKDKEEHFLRNDAPCMLMDLLRLLLSIAATQKWKIGEMDSTAAFLQANGFARAVYVISPKNHEINNDVLWMLTAAAYGLRDSGRLWYLTSNTSLTDTYGLTRCKTENALYYKHDNNRNLKFLLVIQVDNYIYTGAPKEMQTFEEFLQNEFQVDELKQDSFSIFGSKLNKMNYTTLLYPSIKK